MSTNRKILTVVSVLVLLFAFMALLAETTRSTPMTGSGTPSRGLGREFVKLYELRHGPLEADQAYELSDNGHQMCSLLDKGFTLEQAFDEGVESGMSSDQTVTVISSAIYVYCPVHKNMMEG